MDKIDPKYYCQLHTLLYIFYMDRNLMVENTIFDEKPEPLEISVS